MKRQLFLTGYDEIGLKGKNRSKFVKLLIRNIAWQTGLNSEQISHYQKRLYIEIPSNKEPRDLVSSMKKVFGISWFALTDNIGFDYDGLLETGVERGKRHANRGYKTFKIETRRSKKDYPKRSKDINDELGDAIRIQSGLEVDVHNPDVTFNVEVRRKGIYMYTDTNRYEGLGGLPTGSSGRVLSLFSGGIDSPVAAWHLMKRGLAVDLIHYHSPPYTGKKVLEKVKNSADVLRKWSGEEMTLWICPFTEIQEAIADKIPSRYWTIYHRRFMMRIAERLAKQQGYGALATGDSVGQVASQTLSNLSAIDQAIETLVLRPLMGMNKQEIVDQAKIIDTFEISTQPFEDCCVLFAPDQPATTSEINKIVELEKRLDVDQLIANSLENIRQETSTQEEVEL